MNHYEIVKILLLIKLLISNSLLTKSDSWQIEPNLECGTYSIWGKLTKKDDGDFIITLRAGSQSPLEFIVLGGSIFEKEINNDLYINANIYIPRKITSPIKPIVFLQNISKNYIKPKKEINLTKIEDCNNHNRLLF